MAMTLDSPWSLERGAAGRSGRRVSFLSHHSREKVVMCTQATGLGNVSLSKLQSKQVGACTYVSAACQSGLPRPCEGGVAPRSRLEVSLALLVTRGVISSTSTLLLMPTLRDLLSFFLDLSGEES